MIDDADGGVLIERGGAGQGGASGVSVADHIPCGIGDGGGVPVGGATPVADGVVLPVDDGGR